MRVTYLHPSSHHYDDVFGSKNEVRGEGLQDIRVYNHRGGSLFGVLGSLVRRSLPFLKRIILPEVGNFVRNVADDVGQNISFGQSMKNNALNSTKNIGKKIMRGGKLVKKKRKKQNIRNKKMMKIKNKKKRKQRSIKSCNSDIFSSNKYDL